MTIINKYNNIIIKYIQVILSIYPFPCWFVGLLVGDFKKFSTVFFIFSFSSITGGVGDFYFYSISPPFIPLRGKESGVCLHCFAGHGQIVILRKLTTAHHIPCILQLKRDNASCTSLLRRIRAGEKSAFLQNKAAGPA